MQKSRPGPQNPVRNEDIHVGQRKKDCKMQPGNHSEVRVEPEAEMCVTQVTRYVSTALVRQAQAGAMALGPWA